MANELPLPTRVEEIDNEIQALELLQQGLNGLTAVRNSFNESIEVLDSMKDDLKGDTISFEDLIKMDVDKTTGMPTVSLDTSKIDPSKLELTEVPADLVQEAIRAQKALEEVFTPLAESQSSLLQALEKLASGLDKASDLFGQVSDGIKQMRDAWDLLDRAMQGDISSEELIEAFDKYFSGMLDILADSIGKVPGLGAFLEQYAKAIKSIIPDLKTISAATLAKNEAIANVFTQPTGDGPPVIENKTLVERQNESIQEQIDALKEERMGLLDAHQAEAARMAKIEVDQLLSRAGVPAEQWLGYTFGRISEVVFGQMYNAFIAWPAKIEQLVAKNPNDPEIRLLEGKIAAGTQELKETWRIQMRMEEMRIEELERLIRVNPHVLQEADLLELQNRFPQLEPAINDIRAGNPMGTPKVSKAAPQVNAEPSEDMTVKVAVAAGGIATKVKVGLVATGVALFVLGASFFFGSGDECPPGSALMAAGEGIYAVADDPCPPEDDPLVSAGGDEFIEDDSDATAKGSDEVSESVDDETDEDTSGATEEPTPAEEPESVLAGGIGMSDQANALAELFDAVDAFIVLGELFGDPSGDWIYSNPETGVKVVYTAADMLFVRRVIGLLTAAAHLELLGNTVFECGLDDGEMVVVCPEGNPAIPNEELALVFMTLSGPVVGSEDEGEAIYAYVVDSDGEPENDWVAHPSFSWDYYQGTDTWFELFHDFESGTWEMEVRSINESKEIETVDLAARAVIMGDTVLFIVPASSAPVDAAFRVSSFIHDGTYSPDVSGGDVPGADPTEPLLQ